jgi:DNA topoisomerase-1
VKCGFNFVDVNFTALLEDDLDRVARGETGKVCVIRSFYDRLVEDLSKVKGIKEESSKTKYECLLCKKKGEENYFLNKKYSKFGEFYSCCNYPTCKFIATVGENGEPVEKVKKKAEYTDFECPVCNGKMVWRDGKFGRFAGCSKFPKCRGMRNLNGEEVKPKSGKKFRKWKKCKE